MGEILAVDHTTSRNAQQGLSVLQEVAVAVQYDGVCVDCGFRIDFVVERSVLVELKAVDRLHGAHEAQLLTYLKLTGIGSFFFG